MYDSAAEMIAKKKQTASIVCIVAAVVLAGSLFLPWLKNKSRRGSVTMSLLSTKMCAGCESMSNLKLARELTRQYESAKQLREEFGRDGDDDARMPLPEKPGTAFAYVALATLVVCLLAAAALAAAGILGLKGRFITQPMALTSVGLVAACLGLVLGCVFLAIKPAGVGLGASWPFFLFGAAVVAAVAGAQMLAKAFAPPEYDPYADPGVDAPLA
ncbi:MAG: hypothetical protein R3B06_22960 [Kofleriaceae bacterium]